VNRARYTGSFVTSLPDWIEPGEFPKVVPIENNQFEATFRYRATSEDVNKVALAGTFNDWNAERHWLNGPDKNGYFHGAIILAKGRYEYKFVIDANLWTHDPENPDRTGPFTNSVLRVRDDR